MAEPPSAVPPSRRGPVARGRRCRHWRGSPRDSALRFWLTRKSRFDFEIAPGALSRSAFGRVAWTCAVSSFAVLAVRRRAERPREQARLPLRLRRALGLAVRHTCQCQHRDTVYDDPPKQTHTPLHHRRRVAVRVAHHPRARRARGEVDVLGHLHAQPGARVRRVGGGDDGGAQALADLVDLGPEAAER